MTTELGQILRERAALHDAANRARLMADNCQRAADQIEDRITDLDREIRRLVPAGPRRRCSDRTATRRTPRLMPVGRLVRHVTT